MMFAVLQVPVAPIDVTSVIAVVMGILVVLIPISGLTARFALKPIAEAVARMREAQGTSQALGLVEQRLALLEQQMSSLESDVKRIEDTTEFDRQLRAGPQETEGA